MDKWMDRRTKVQMKIPVIQDFFPFGIAAQKSPCVLQYFIFFGASALLNSLKFTIMQGRAMGIAYHMLPLGNWYFYGFV